MKMLTMWKVAILEEGIPYLSFPRLHNLLLLLPLFHLVGKEWSSVNHLQNLWFSKNKLLKPSSKSLVVKEWNSENQIKILLWIITKLTLQPFSGSFQDLDPTDCSNIITMIDYHHYHDYHIAQKRWLIITSPLISSARLGLRSEPSTWNFKRLCDWNHYNFAILVKSITATEFFTW